MWHMGQNYSSDHMHFFTPLLSFGERGGISFHGLFRSTTHGVASTTEIYYFTVMEAKSLTEVLVAGVVSEGCEKNPVLCLSPSFWGFASNLRCFVGCRALPSVSHGVLLVCVSVSKYPPFCKDTGYIEVGVRPNSSKTSS